MVRRVSPYQVSNLLERPLAPESTTTVVNKLSRVVINLIADLIA